MTRTNPPRAEMLSLCRPSYLLSLPSLSVPQLRLHRYLLNFSDATLDPPRRERRSSVSWD